jgi:hypothetical protein
MSFEGADCIELADDMCCKHGNECVWMFLIT